MNFVGDSSKWRAIYWGTGIWMGAGYGMIVYLAAMAGINVELYNAAYMDGAGRWKRIWHVTLPQIRPCLLYTSSPERGSFRIFLWRRKAFFYPAVQRWEDRP